MMARARVALAAAASGIALAAVAAAGTVVEGFVRGSGLVLAGGRYEGTYVQRLEPRGDALDMALRRWDYDGGGPSEVRSTRVKRQDLGLTWTLDWTDSSYVEAKFADERELGRIFATGVDSSAWEWSEVPGPPERIAGFATRHFRSRHVAAVEGAGVPAVVCDAWVTTEATGARGVAAAVFPSLEPADARSQRPRAGPGLPRGVMLRMAVALELPAGEAAWLADSDSLGNNLGMKIVDGRLQVTFVEVTSIRAEALPAGALELPKGLRRVPDPNLELIEAWRASRRDSAGLGPGE